MPNLQHKRGTRAALDALAAAGGLKPGQIYLLTDEARIAAATSTSSYQAYAKSGEGGGATGFAAGTGAGRYHNPDTLLFSATALAGVAPGTIIAYPFTRRMMIDALVVEVTTAAAGGRVRMGLYASLASGLPGALIEEAGEVAADTVGHKVGLLAPPRVIDGPVWLAMQWNMAIAMRRGAAAEVGNAMPGQTTFATTNNATYLTRAAAYGPFPASFDAPTTVANGFNYMVAVRQA